MRIMRVIRIIGAVHLKNVNKKYLKINFDLVTHFFFIILFCLNFNVELLLVHI